MYNEEIWKFIKGYDNYKISSYGRVFNVDTNYFKKLTISKGYLTVILNKNGVEKKYRVHRLVAESFLDNIENKLIVNHINGIKTDNNIYNLEWVTASENSIHSYKIGTNKIFNGEDNNQAKLSSVDILEIYHSTAKHYNIAKHFNISVSHVSTIKNKKTWKHVLNNDNNIFFRYLTDVDLVDNSDGKENIQLSFEHKQINSFPNYTIDIHGNIYNKKRNKYLDYNKNNIEYVRVELYNDGICKRYYLHYLLAEHFIENIEKKSVVNHINGIKNDNRLENLEWVTQSENILHAYKSGLSIPQSGVLNGATKLSEQQIIDIFNMKDTCINISKKFNISSSHVSAIKNKKRWKHLLEDK